MKYSLDEHMNMMNCSVTYRKAVTSLLGLLYVAQYNKADSILPGELLAENQSFISTTMSRVSTYLKTTDHPDCTTMNWLGDTVLVR